MRRTDRDPEAEGFLSPLRNTLLVVGVLLVAVVVTVAVGLLVYSPPSAGDVTVALKDYAIVMPATLHAGSHTLAVTNVAKQPHELVLFRTDLPAGALPVDADGAVVEDSPQLAPVADTGAALSHGRARSLPAKLSPGHYVAVCNLSDHYQRGMYADLRVR